MELIQWNTSPSLVKTLGLFSQKKKERERKKNNHQIVFSFTQKVVKQKCENDVLAPGFQKKRKRKKLLLTNLTSITFKETD